MRPDTGSIRLTSGAGLGKGYTIRCNSGVGCPELYVLRHIRRAGEDEREWRDAPSHERTPSHRTLGQPSPGRRASDQDVGDMPDGSGRNPLDHPQRQIVVLAALETLTEPTDLLD